MIQFWYLWHESNWWHVMPFNTSHPFLYGHTYSRSLGSEVAYFLTLLPLFDLNATLHTSLLADGEYLFQFQCVLHESKWRYVMLFDTGNN